MPVMRQPVNTGSSQLQLGDTNYMVGTASPSMQQVQPENDARGAAITNFMQGFAGTFSTGIQEGQARAKAQGEMDADGDPNALQDSDDAAGQQNIFMRKAYQQGYLGAAVQQKVSEYQAGITQRAQQAGLAGKTTQQFLDDEKQGHAQLMQSMQQYLPHMDTATVEAVAGALNNTKQSALNILTKTAAGQAKINNTRAIENGSFAAGQSFITAAAANGPEAAYHYIEDQAKLIATNPGMTQEEKDNEISNMFITTAQSIKDPNTINFLAGKGAGLLGVSSGQLTSAMTKEWNRAGQQGQTAAMVDVLNDMQKISSLPAYQQDAARNNVLNKAIQYNTQGYLGNSQVTDIYNQMHKQQKPGDIMKGMVQTAMTNGGGVSVEAMHSANPGVSRGEVQSAILDAYPNTPQGNSALLAAGQQGHDPWVMQQALQRVGTSVASDLGTLQLNGTMTKDENGNEQFTIPQSVQQNLVGFAGMYKAADPITRSTLLNTLPDDWRGVIQSAIEQDPNNVNNNILDTVKRIATEQKSGLYTDVKAQPTAKMLDTSSALQWYQHLIPGNTTDMASERAQRLQQLQAEYNNLYQTNRGLLSGKSEQSINQMLTGMIEARTVPLKAGDFNAPLTLPQGTTLDTYASRVGVNSSFYGQAIQQTVNSTFSKLGVNASNIDRVQIIPGSGGPSSNDFVMSVDVKQPNGTITSQNVSLPISAINQSAIGLAHDSAVNQQRAGTQMAGPAVATYKDVDANGVRTMTIQGPNSVGWVPSQFNSMIANTMQYEGLKRTQSANSVGFGHHSASGDVIPEQVDAQSAVQNLKDVMQSRYIPMMQGYMQKAGVTGDDVKPMLADLTYERPADAQTLISEMGKFQSGQVSYPDLVNTLQSLPSWKDAGGGASTQRNKDRMQALYVWASLRTGRGNSAAENPVSAIGQQ